MATRTVRLPAQEVPVSHEADVVVVGGGTSGFIAATAAARLGARTLLVERFGYLGGCTTTTYNTGLGAFGDSEGNQIIAGLGWEFVKRMEREGQCFLSGHRPQLWPPWTKKVALDMVEEAGVTLLFYTWVEGVVKDGDVVSGLVVVNKGGRQVIRARAFVDASGDADVAAFAGAPFEMTPVEELQQVSCDYTACGVDAAKVVAWARENKEKLRGVGGSFEHQAAGAQPMFTFVVPNPDTSSGHHVGVMPTVKLCIYREAVRLQGNADIDPLDPAALTTAETAGLRGALGHLEYLRKLMPGFENAFLVAQNHLGVRETRRIVGDYMIGIDDIRNNSRFDDVVALNCRALDYHLRGTVFKIEMPKGNHDVPLRALTPKGVRNLAVVGRCVSCDHLAQASLRGAATCMATGHAGGVAAAMAARADGDIRALGAAPVQRELLGQGAILGTGQRATLLRKRVAEAG
jgi:ribulose 1,5-bisphosphate synthetase/thiazole synthase